MKERKQSGKFLPHNSVQIASFEELLKDSEVRSQMDLLDTNTGYSKNKDLEDIKSAFESHQRVDIDDKVSNFVKYVNDKGYSVLETLDFYKKYGKDIFGKNSTLNESLSNGEFALTINVKQDGETIVLRKSNDSAIEIIK